MRVGDERIGSTIGPVGPEDFMRYARASGDPNPVHWDRGFAVRAGYPDVFAMGMFPGGLLATYVERWMGAGTLRRFKVRFISQVWPGDLLVCGGRVKRLIADAGKVSVECDLWVATQNQEIKVRGAATCVLSAHD
jgi:acyl dehydratase